MSIVNLDVEVGVKVKSPVPVAVMYSVYVPLAALLAEPLTPPIEGVTVPTVQLLIVYTTLYISFAASVVSCTNAVVPSPSLSTALLLYVHSVAGTV